MKRITGFIVAGFFILTLALLLPALQKDDAEPAEKPKAVVGFVKLLSESTWRDKVTQSISEAAQANDVQLITLEAERTQDSQIQAIRKLITYKVDAIVFSPVVMSGWDNVLRETQAAGIPVVLTERRVKTSVEGAVAAYVGSDYELQGAEAAQYLVRTMSGRHGAVRVMELTGTVGSSSSTERSRGIRAVLGENEKFDLFYSLSCDLMFSKAKETLEIYLINGGHPDVLICYNDAMAFGAIEAIEKRGLRPGKDIVVVSFDAQQQAVDYLGEGKINCEIETNPNVGGEIMQAIAALDEGGWPREILLTDAVFTDEAETGAIAPRGY